MFCTHTQTQFITGSHVRTQTVAPAWTHPDTCLYTDAPSMVDSIVLSTFYAFVCVRSVFLVFAYLLDCVVVCCSVGVVVRVAV